MPRASPRADAGGLLPGLRGVRRINNSISSAYSTKSIVEEVLRGWVSLDLSNPFLVRRHVPMGVDIAEH